MLDTTTPLPESRNSHRRQLVSQQARSRNCNHAVPIKTPSRAACTVAAQLGVDVRQRAQRERVVLVGKAALRLRDLLHPCVQLRGLAQRGLAAAPPGATPGPSQCLHA